MTRNEGKMQSMVYMSMDIFLLKKYGFGIQSSYHTKDQADLSKIFMVYLLVILLDNALLFA